MCIICERELWGEHRALESEFFKLCRTCKKFPGTNSDGTCYHCFLLATRSGRVSRVHGQTME